MEYSNATTAPADHTGDTRTIARPDDELDPVTGLVGRSAGIERLATMVERDDRSGSVAVVLVDIDRLDDVNDALGHEVGDHLIVSVARRLEGGSRPGDLVARSGGDEFLVARPGLASETDAVEFADRIRRALSGRLSVGGLDLEVSASVGVTVVSPATAPPTRFDGTDHEATHRALELLAEAHTALRVAKRAGRGRSVQFTPDLALASRDRAELAVALSAALRNGEIEVDYQPIFSAVSQFAEGAEALVRWRHPTRGRLDAADFIGLAEETGTALVIGDWVLAAACGAARRWIDDGVVGPRFAVHVNVTRRQLARPAFALRVVDLLAERRLRPRQLVLEVRESSLIGHDADAVTETLGALRSAGVRIAIDNFGTGSNALTLLTEVGADVLKLDGRLALPTGSSDDDGRVVQALVALAHTLGMEVVAERVVDLDQLRRLRAAGCDLVQGHLGGRPAAADALAPRMDP